MQITGISKKLEGRGARTHEANLNRREGRVFTDQI